ncbi:putative alpha/beta superfamily hydrolase [Rheinheimera pacifica]|uniref:alpha/beta hydrolase n=1 Tax=Rheinheimera pacifica TaxID=173990 RepID=UPI00285DAF9F|nr:alpha/beta hydrolase-fold protein [Rheinheimera pacifica]MDR6982270.1 putative alpha/beta superfamily hydrolase [Rheinheimera pacifica]
MKKIIFGLMLLIFGSHWSTGAAQNYPEIQQLVIDSTVLAEKRNLVVYLPAGYQNNKDSFPVLYITDGDIHGPHTAGTLDYLAKFEQTPQMIVVGISNPRQTRDRDLTVTSADKQNTQQLENADRFLAFIEQEVIPFVKQRYRTLDYQALSGTSHGGQFAINALVKRPGLFNGVIAISPSLYWDKLQMLELAEAALKSRQLQGSLYVSIANEESTMTEPFQQFVELTKRYASENLAVASQIFSDETHNTTVLQGQYYGLKHLFSGWAIPESPQTLADLQTIFARRSKLLNTSMIIPEDRAAGYGQWLQYLNRQDDALALLKWNRANYPQSLNAHTALIKAYLHFKLAEDAKAALEDALRSIKGLNSEQKAQLEALFT